MQTLLDTKRAAQERKIARAVAREAGVSRGVAVITAYRPPSRPSTGGKAAL